MQQITIPNERREVVVNGYTGSGPFEFEWVWFEKADITVRVNGKVLVDTDWVLTPTLTLIGGFQGGEITLITAVTNADIVVSSEVQPGRISDFGVAGAKPQDVNSAIDRIHAIMVDQKTVGERTIQFTPGDDSVTAFLPFPADRADQILAWGADGRSFNFVSRVNVDIVAGISTQIQNLEEISGSIVIAALPDNIAAYQVLADPTNLLHINVIGTDFADPNSGLVAVANDLSQGADGFIQPLADQFEDPDSPIYTAAANANLALTSRNEAQTFRDQSEGFSDDAEGFSETAKTHRDTARDHSFVAESNKNDAEIAASASQTSAGASETSASQAGTAAALAQGSATAASAASAQTIGFRDDAEQFSLDAEGHADDALQRRIDTDVLKNSAQDARDIAVERASQVTDRLLGNEYPSEADLQNAIDAGDEVIEPGVTIGKINGVQVRITGVNPVTTEAFDVGDSIPEDPFSDAIEGLYDAAIDRINAGLADAAGITIEGGASTLILSVEQDRPANPVTYAQYLVGEGGSWAASIKMDTDVSGPTENAIAIWSGERFNYKMPRDGTKAYIQSLNAPYEYKTGMGWQIAATEDTPEIRALANSIPLEPSDDARRTAAKIARNLGAYYLRGKSSHTFEVANYIRDIDYTLSEKIEDAAPPHFYTPEEEQKILDANHAASDDWATRVVNLPHYAAVDLVYPKGRMPLVDEPFSNETQELIYNSSSIGSFDYVGIHGSETRIKNGSIIEASPNWRNGMGRFKDWTQWAGMCPASLLPMIMQRGSFQQKYQMSGMTFMGIGKLSGIDNNPAGPMIVNGLNNWFQGFECYGLGNFGFMGLGLFNFIGYWHIFNCGQWGQTGGTILGNPAGYHPRQRKFQMFAASGGAVDVFCKASEDFDGIPAEANLPWFSDGASHDNLSNHVGRKVMVAQGHNDGTLAQPFIGTIIEVGDPITVTRNGIDYSGFTRARILPDVSGLTLHYGEHQINFEPIRANLTAGSFTADLNDRLHLGNPDSGAPDFTDAEWKGRFVQFRGGGSKGRNMVKGPNDPHFLFTRINSPVAASGSFSDGFNQLSIFEEPDQNANNVLVDFGFGESIGMCERLIRDDTVWPINDHVLRTSQSLTVQSDGNTDDLTDGLVASWRVIGSHTEIQGKMHGSNPPNKPLIASGSVLTIDMSKTTRLSENTLTHNMHTPEGQVHLSGNTMRLAVLSPRVGSWQIIPGCTIFHHEVPPTANIDDWFVFYDGLVMVENDAFGETPRDDQKVFTWSGLTDEEAAKRIICRGEIIGNRGQVLTGKRPVDGLLREQIIELLSDQVLNAESLMLESDGIINYGLRISGSGALNIVNFDKTTGVETATPVKIHDGAGNNALQIFDNSAVGLGGLLLLSSAGMDAASIPSGATQPSGLAAGRVWYDTANNVFRRAI